MSLSLLAASVCAAALASPPSARVVVHAERSFTVVTVDPATVRVSLVGQGPRGDDLRRAQTLRDLHGAIDGSDQALVFATNAGMFHADRAPVGLFVADGHEHSALNTSAGNGNFFLSPNGVFWMDAAGAVHVTESQAYALASPPGVVFATQSGPMLVQGGVLHPALTADSPNLRVRSGVGVSPDGQLHVVISNEVVRFHELATLFRDALDAPDALYLDGVISALESALGTQGKARHRWAGLIVGTVPVSPAVGVP